MAAAEATEKLLQAAYDGDVEAALAALAAGADPNGQSDNWMLSGRTAILFAAQNGNLPIVKALVERGAKTDAVDRSQKNCLHNAAAEGKAEVLQYLLENAKMDLEATDDGGKTALYWAVGYDRLDCYKLLVQHGAKVDIKDNNGYPLLFAAENEITKDLLGRGLSKDVNTVVGGNVPLMAAAQHSTTVAMQALLDAGADVNYANEIGVTALHVAAKGGKTEAIKLLLQRGAQSEAKLSNGATPLLMACFESGIELEPVAALLAGGADARAELLEVRLTALHLAANNGKLDIVTALLDAGADVNAVTNDGTTALMAAASRSDGGADIVELLLKRGAKRDCVDAEGKTARQMVQEENEEAAQRAEARTLLAV